MTLLILNDGTVKGTTFLNEKSRSFFLSILQSSLNSYTILIMFIGVDIEKETEQHQCALLEFIPSNPPGAFRLRGVASNLYLAMDKKGMLYGEENYEDDHTLFVEHADVRS